VNSVIFRNSTSPSFVVNIPYALLKIRFLNAKKLYEQARNL
jgi:hypothetical protein